MHDIDRTMQEMEYEGELELEFDDDELEMEYDDDEMDYNDDEFELEYDDGEMEFEIGESPFTQEEEMELATQLLSVNSDEELDLFFRRLGRRIKRGFKKAGRFLKSKRFRRILKGLTKRALPIAGKAAGAYFGGPVGSKIGGMVGSYASSLFELELEGLSPEDQEFEIARRIVRFAGVAAQNADKLSRKMPANKAMTAGIKMAAKKNAPGLLKRKAGKKFGKSGSYGKWVRKGNRIILYGA